MYKIEGNQGFAGVLVARRACSAKNRSFEDQLKFYDAAASLLKDVVFKKHTVDGFYELNKTITCRSTAAAVLKRMKINSEDSDPQTVACLNALQMVEQTSAPLVTASAALAAFNGRPMIQYLRRQLSKAKTPVDGTALLSMVEEAGKQLPPKSWFTTSFDKRAAHSRRKKAIFKTRLRSVRKVALKKGVYLRGNRFGQCVSRIGLSMTFASVMPVLRARNAFALLEHFFLKQSEKNGRPLWVKEAGSLMGPGAIGAANLLSGEFKGLSATGSSRVDASCNMGKSVLIMKRFRRLFKDERDRLMRLKPESVAKRRLRQELLDACDQILAMSDCQLEFVQCELSKIIDAVHGSVLRARHCRRPCKRGVKRKLKRGVKRKLK